MTASLPGTRPAAEVQVADAHDRLVIVPDDRRTSLELASTLRSGPAAEMVGRGGGRLTVPASKAPALLALADQLPLRWSETAHRFAANRAQATECRHRFLTAFHQLQQGGRPAAEQALAGTLDLDVLDEHQVINVAAMTHPDCVGLAVFDEQGAGKTVTGVYAIDVLASRDEADLALVVAPKSMVGEWPQDVARFKGQLYRAAVLSGNRTQRRSLLARPPDLLVANFEAVVSMETELTALARRLGGRCVLLIDESFYVKNREAARSRALRRLREWFSRAYVLCGTPAPNSAADLVGQFDIADFGLTFGGLALPRNREDAHQAVQAILEQRGVYLRSLKQDVLPHLPGRTLDTVRVELAPQQRRAYDAASNQLAADLRTIDDASFRRSLRSFAARRATLLQLCSNPSRLLPDYDEIPGKLAALDALLSDLIESKGEKVVVWSFFTASLDAITGRYGHYGVVRFDGTVTSVDERRRAVRAFQEDPEVRLFVGNPAAAGAGLTLHAARYAVYESMSNQAAHYLQSLDRVHRRGQGRGVHYLVLLAQDTIEEHAFSLLRHKEAAAHRLLGDATQLIATRESMLAELLGNSDCPRPGTQQ